MTGVVDGRTDGRGAEERGAVLYKHIHLSFLSAWTKDAVLAPSGAGENHLAASTRNTAN